MTSSAIPDGASADGRQWWARADVFARHSATSLILLPAEGPGVKLNGPAELIWELTRPGASVDQVSIDIAEVFDHEVDVIRPFVVETLDALNDAGLVEER